MSEQEFSELAEADAPADIAAIYAEIRRLSGVPMVALIFRHLATFEGVLQEAWGASGALFRTGVIQQSAWAVAARHAVPELLPPIEPNARAVLGLEGAELDRARHTIEAYNRANPINLLAMLCLLERIEHAQDEHCPPPAVHWSPPPPIVGPMPAMVAPRDMTPQVRRLLNDLGLGDRSRIDPVVPSLYRHFANAPHFLALLHVLLVPAFRDGRLAHAVDRMRAGMHEEAAKLVRFVPPMPGLAAAPGVPDALRAFTSGLIPQMILIGISLRAALD